MEYKINKANKNIEELVNMYVNLLIDKEDFNNTNFEEEFLELATKYGYYAKIKQELLDKYLITDDIVIGKTVTILDCYDSDYINRQATLVATSQHKTGLTLYHVVVDGEILYLKESDFIV